LSSFREFHRRCSVSLTGGQGVPIMFVRC
jgi:hypothetical protein